MPTKWHFYTKVHTFLNWYWDPREKNNLINDHEHKYAFYKRTKYFGTNLTYLLAWLFENNHDKNIYEEPSWVHENSVFLYKSPQADDALYAKWVHILNFIPAICAYAINPAFLAVYVFNVFFYVSLYLFLAKKTSSGEILYT